MAFERANVVVSDAAADCLDGVPAGLAFAQGPLRFEMKQFERKKVACVITFEYFVDHLRRFAGGAGSHQRRYS